MSAGEDLPIPDWDQQPAGSLPHRIRSLDSDGVRTLLRHEESHADRPAVRQVLTARLEELVSGAEPASGGENEPSDAASGSRHGSPVDPATAAPPRHDPPHGNPRQPGEGYRQGPGT
ncbi:hypothetical protein HUT13_26005 [Streptomyces harbinensis]|uniref:hypothetical protein n=1 Tax=Streptomyces harbinensis TaxID=1176198 RepID=UPI0015929E2F|nr:hypothetical protein [Streptomyces harbinensis]QKV71845.1 hypothetical protein HUT13_26005 [Streptomyces harbinensis]